MKWGTILRLVQFVHTERRAARSAILPEWRRVGGMPQVTPCQQLNLRQQLHLEHCEPVPTAHHVLVAGHTNQSNHPIAEIHDKECQT